jgi:septal ring factor EnvC (AmiA/AmiB activator)
MTDESEVPALRRKIAELEEWLAAERERREAVDERLRDARDELRRQQAEMAEMQKVNGQLRGKISQLDTESKKPRVKRSRRPRR